MSIHDQINIGGILLQHRSAKGLLYSVLILSVRIKGYIEAAQFTAVLFIWINKCKVGVCRQIGYGTRITDVMHLFLPYLVKLLLLLRIKRYIPQCIQSLEDLAIYYHA